MVGVFRTGWKPRHEGWKRLRDLLAYLERGCALRMIPELGSVARAGAARLDRRRDRLEARCRAVGLELQVTCVTA
jgi:hypothetical protein